MSERIRWVKTPFSRMDHGGCALLVGAQGNRIVEIKGDPEECWPDIKILNELGKTLGRKKYWHEDYEGLLEEVQGPSGLTYGQFVERGYLLGPDRPRKYVLSGFKTPSGKVEFRLVA